MFHVVDSSGWLEYLTEGSNAGAFATAITASDGLIVPTITLYEVFRFVARKRDDVQAAQSVALMMRGEVVDLDAKLALAAARLAAQHRLPMADSIILATARRFEATLWTQDADFAGLDGVKYVPKSG